MAIEGTPLFFYLKTITIFPGIYFDYNLSKSNIPPCIPKFVSSFSLNKRRKGRKERRKQENNDNKMKPKQANKLDCSQVEVVGV